MIPITTQDYITNILANLTSPQVNDLSNQLNDMGTNNLTHIVDILGPIIAPELSRYRLLSIQVYIYLYTWISSNKYT